MRVPADPIYLNEKGDAWGPLVVGDYGDELDVVTYIVIPANTQR